MINGQTQFSKFETLLSSQEQYLLLLQDQVLDLLSAKHTTKETEAFQAAVNKANLEINDILRSLLKTKEASPSFKDEADRLCQRCRDLKNHTRDVDRKLSDDLIHQAQNKADFIKLLTFLFAIPAFFVSLIKNGLGDNLFTVPQAAEAGFIVSGTVIFHKKIKRGFVLTSKSICETPKQIKNSFLLFYLKETAKEKNALVRTAFGQGANALTTTASKMATRGKTFTKKLLGAKKNEL